MREKSDYRDNLELLTSLYPNRIELTVDETATLIKKHRQTIIADDKFPKQKIGSKYIVPIVGLARWLSVGGE